jgi:hypothetical protein
VPVGFAVFALPATCSGLPPPAPVAVRYEGTSGTLTGLRATAVLGDVALGGEAAEIEVGCSHKAHAGFYTVLA